MQVFVDNKEKLDKILSLYKKTCNLLTYEEVLLDKKLFLNLEKKKKKYEIISKKYAEFLELFETLNKLQKEQTVLIGEEKKLYQQEIDEINSKIKTLSNEVKNLLIQWEMDIQTITIEIYFNKNEISKKLANDLVKGYANFCSLNDFNVELIQEKNKFILNISGVGAKNCFQNEIGNHEVLYSKESTCHLFVFDELPNENIKLDEDDIVISTCRSSGAGGQHVNTTDSSIKITHIKSGISAISQDERSQIQNKQKALERLAKKLKAHYEIIKNKEIAKQKDSQLKKVNSNFIVKTFDYDNDKILTFDKKEIRLKEFLEGKIIN